MITIDCSYKNIRRKKKIHDCFSIPKLKANLSVRIGPHSEVVCATVPLTAFESPSLCNSNIIVIHTDDLGFSDTSFYAGTNQGQP